jgi:dual adaptor for phosphotyrosine/3-phosphotyrosine/3-phosphoinositide
VRTEAKGGGACLLCPNNMAASVRRSRFEEIEAGLEIERRARERQEREQGKGKRISTLHRESDFTLEWRVSPPPAPAPRRPPPPVQGAALPSSKTDVSVRYAPCPRTDGKNRGVRGEGERATEPAVGEFERRLLNAKRLGKAPMPSVDSIPWYHPSISRHIAESLLMHTDILCGTFLLRNSSNSDESLTLSVRCRAALRHYRVHWDGRNFCFGLGKFPDVASLENHFSQQPMISGDCGVLVKLAHTYPRGVVEPHDYQEAHEVSSMMEATIELLSSPSLSVNSKEGFLTKLGYHRKNWKIRWFTLVRNELKYFNTKDDKSPLRVINLEEATAVGRDDTMGKPNCFRSSLSHTLLACRYVLRTIMYTPKTATLAFTI